MARATTYTGLAIDTWAEILSVDPWEFNGFTTPQDKSAQCAHAFRQFGFQADHINREEVAEAIAAAETMLADELIFYPYPKYFIDEKVMYPRPHQRDAWGAAGTARGEWKTIQLLWHHVQSGGVFNRMLIGNIAAGAITTQDNDGDGVFETFTATITDPAIGNITDARELGIYFVAGDRHGEDIGETWRVRPVKVTIAGNTATFRGHRTLLTNPAKAYAVNQSNLDPATAANYVTSLDCYRAFTDTTATAPLNYQGVAIWKNDPDCTQDCTFSLLPLCLGEHLNEQGIVFASFGTTSCWPFGFREPDRLQVNYVAGLELDSNGQMQRDAARAVTYLSVSLLAHEKCGCDRSNRVLAYYRDRIAKFVDNAANATAYQDSTNPFPATVGGAFAWNWVKNHRNVEIVGI
jgi:hypothetical protein